MTFDEASIEAIARVLGAEAVRAPFDVPAGPGRAQARVEKREPVYQMRLDSRELGQPLLLTLWPSLGRVDVRLGRSYWALKGIASVELYPGVEVLFRREEPPALLFVSVRGRVALIA